MGCTYTHLSIVNWQLDNPCHLTSVDTGNYLKTANKTIRIFLMQKNKNLNVCHVFESKAGMFDDQWSLTATGIGYRTPEQLWGWVFSFGIFWSSVSITCQNPHHIKNNITLNSFFSINRYLIQHMFVTTSDIP